MSVLAPMVAQGVIKRRPWAVALAQRWQADDHAVRLLQKLEGRYGPGPLRLRIPGRSAALVLAPADAWRVLAQSPEPFAPATREKKAALAQFEPHGVLVSEGVDRTVRRRFNEAVLDTTHPDHECAEDLLVPVRQEVSQVIREVERSGELAYGTYSSAWNRAVRRLVLGDAARDDAARRAASRGELVLPGSDQVGSSP